MTNESEQLVHDELTELRSSMDSMQAELKKLHGPLVTALKRDKAFDGMKDQLQKAEQVAEAWRSYPLVLGIHEAILMLRNSETTETDVLKYLESILEQAGVQEFGFEDEQVEPTQVEITKHSGSGRILTVSKCERPGLIIGPSPLRKPIVQIKREEEGTLS